MSSMEDLVEFLRDCYDEEEADAHKAMKALVPIGPVSRELPAEPVEWVLNRLPAAVRQHIARHDPARVLREVKAKRRIIEIHKLEVAKDPARFNQLTGEQLPDVYEVNCAVCGWATDDPTSGCETLRLLALPCADRPGYREEWKP